MRDVRRDEDEIERPLTRDLVGDVDVAALGVKRFGRLHRKSLRRSRFNGNRTVDGQSFDYRLSGLRGRLQPHFGRLASA